MRFITERPARVKMKKPDDISRKCPFCNNESVVRNGFSFGFKSPPFECTKCDVKLKTVATKRTALVIPVVLSVFPAMYILILINDTYNIPTALYLAAVGLTGNLFYSLSMKILFKSLAYKKWRQRGNA